MKSLVSPLPRSTLTLSSTIPGHFIPRYVRKGLWVTHAAAEAELGTLHTVQTGETLAQIALAYGVSVEQIQEALPKSHRGRRAILRSDTTLQPGQKLIVNRSGNTTAVPGLGLPGLAQSWQPAPLVAACLGGALLATGAFKLLSLRKSSTGPVSPSETKAAGVLQEAPAPGTAEAAASRLTVTATAQAVPILSAVSEVRALLQDAEVEIHAVESALAAVRRATASANAENPGAAHAASKSAAVCVTSTTVPTRITDSAAAVPADVSPREEALSIATATEIPDTPPAEATAMEQLSAVPTVPVAAGHHDISPRAAVDAADPSQSFVPADSIAMTRFAVEQTQVADGDVSTTAEVLEEEEAEVGLSGKPVTTGVEGPDTAVSRPEMVESPWATFDTATQVAAARARVQAALEAAYGLMLSVPIRPPPGAADIAAAAAAGGPAAEAKPATPAVTAIELNNNTETESSEPLTAEAARLMTAEAEASPLVMAETESLPLVTAEALDDVAQPMDAVSAGQVLDRIRNINKLLEQDQQLGDVDPPATAVAVGEAAKAPPEPAETIDHLSVKSAAAMKEQPLDQPLQQLQGQEWQQEQEQVNAGSVQTLTVPRAADTAAVQDVQVFEPEVEYDDVAVAASQEQSATDRERATGLLAKIDVLLASFDTLSSEDEAALAELQDKATSRPAVSSTDAVAEPPATTTAEEAESTPLPSMERRTPSTLILSLPQVLPRPSQPPAENLIISAETSQSASAAPITDTASTAEAVTAVKAVVATAPSQILALTAEALEAVVRPLGAQVANEVLDRIRDIGKVLDEEQRQSDGSSTGSAAEEQESSSATAAAAAAWHAGSTADGVTPQKIADTAMMTDTLAVSGGGGGTAGVGEADAAITGAAVAVASPGAFQQSTAKALPAAKGFLGLLSPPSARAALPPPSLTSRQMQNAIPAAGVAATIGTNWTMTPPAPLASADDLEPAAAVLAGNLATEAVSSAPVPTAPTGSLPSSPQSLSGPRTAASQPIPPEASLQPMSLSGSPPPLPPPVQPPPSSPPPLPPPLQPPPSSPPPLPPPVQPPPSSPMPSGSPVQPPPRPPLLSPQLAVASANPVLQKPATAAAAAAVGETTAAETASSSAGPGPRRGLSSGAAAGFQRAQLKSRLLDLVYGTSRGVSATASQRASIEETVESLELLNPNSMATDAVSALGGRWKLIYTSNVPTLVLLGALDGMPLVDVGDVAQIIDPEGLTATNKIDLAIPLLVSLRAEAGLEVRSPRQFKVRLTRVGLDTYVSTPQLLAALEVPPSITVLGATLDLTPLRKLLEPINIGLEAAQDLLGRAVAPEFAVDSVPVPPGMSRGSVTDAASLWMLTTYLDDTLRISRDDEGRVFVMLKDVDISLRNDSLRSASPR